MVWIPRLTTLSCGSKLVLIFFWIFPTWCSPSLLAPVVDRDMWDTPRAGQSSQLSGPNVSPRDCRGVWTWSICKLKSSITKLSPSSSTYMVSVSWCQPSILVTSLCPWLSVVKGMFSVTLTNPDTRWGKFPASPSFTDSINTIRLKSELINTKS